ncbi:hypothetical protein NFI96_005322 [Prochilodus magdalenae]|nr:hypothetical protein NFI96_005322 [Prochilodus magdalenae]
MLVGENEGVMHGEGRNMPGYHVEPEHTHTRTHNVLGSPVLRGTLWLLWLPQDYFSPSKQARVLRPGDRGDVPPSPALREKARGGPELFHHFAMHCGIRSPASDYRKRRKSEPSGTANEQNAGQAPARPLDSSRSSTLKKPAIRSSPSSPSRGKAGGASESLSPSVSSPGMASSRLSSDSLTISTSTLRSSKRSICFKNGWPASQQEGVDTWSSVEEEEASSPRLKSRSCDDLLSDGNAGMPGRASGAMTATRSESAGSLIDEGEAQQQQAKSLNSSPRGRRHHRRKMAHETPGFLQLYKKMHHIDRAQLLPSEVIRSVRARILELERQQQQRKSLHAWPPFGHEVPQRMVPNRISEYEQLIQKSKSMPDLGEDNTPSGTTTPGSSRASSCPKRRFSVESLLEEEDPPERSPPEGQPRPGAESRSLVPVVRQNQHQHQDYSDSEQDACASELSDFIQIEGSSFCSESDLDHCSLASSESFYGSGHHHHHHHHHHHGHRHHGSHHHHHHQSLGQSQGYHHRHLISSCKGRCPASYTRFTTMLKHERARQESRAAVTPPLAQHSPNESGLSKLAFLVSPVPFRRKRGSPPTQRRHSRSGRHRSKTSVYEALDSALQDIYDHIRAEKGLGPARLPDDSILRRLLEELLPDVPERSSSLRGHRGSYSPSSSSSHFYQPYHSASYQQPLHRDASNNNQHANANANANAACYSDQGSDAGTLTPQNRRPTPDREVMTPFATEAPTQCFHFQSQRPLSRGSSEEDLVDPPILPPPHYHHHHQINSTSIFEREENIRLHSGIRRCFCPSTVKTPQCHGSERTCSGPTSSSRRRQTEAETEKELLVLL